MLFVFARPLLFFGLANDHLNRTKQNLKKTSASLFLMLLSSLSLDDDELSEKATLFLDIQSPSSRGREQRDFAIKKTA